MEKFSYVMKNIKIIEFLINFSNKNNLLTVQQRKDLIKRIENLMDFLNSDNKYH